jgi:Transport and Golgi organisation 2
VCTVVLSFEPGERVPLLLLGVRDEVTDRPWLPPARHWPGSPLVGGLDKQAGGTWLAVDPDIPRVACLLNGRDKQALLPPPTGPDRPPGPAGRRSRGELPLRAAADGAGVLKELADDPDVLADTGLVRLLSWDGDSAARRDLEPGTHLFTNVGHAYPGAPGAPVTEPKAIHFGAKFAASRPSGDPALPPGQAWGDWLAYAAGDGLDPGDPSAIIARRDLPDGRVWGTTSLSLVALGAGGVRYDFRPQPGAVTDWYPVIGAA